MRTLPALACMVLVASGIEPCGARPGEACGPGNGDCCIADGTPGCDDIECCQAVCAVDPFCCDIEWDDICVGQVCPLCPSSECCGTPGCCGAPGSGNCCLPNGTPCCDDLDCCELICAFDPFCCDTQWDLICSDEANESCFCEPPHPCFGTGDCCAPQDGPSCGDLGCCEVVCFLDSFCCFIQWDALCVEAACTLCGDLCDGAPACPLPCGPEAPCPPGEICEDGTCIRKPPGNDDCKTAAALVVPPGGTTAVQGIMFAATFDAVPFCGALQEGPGVWYSVTGNGNVMTASTCNLAPFDTRISVFCGSCPTASSSACCLAGEGPGCDDPVCEARVCGFFPFCCATEWRALCADVALLLCAACQGEGTCVTGADDSAGCALGTTEVSWCAIAGAEYLILVHGPSGTDRDFLLEVSDGGAPCRPEVECPAACMTVTGQSTKCLGDGGSFNVHIEGINACTGGPMSFDFTGAGGDAGEEICVDVALYDEAGAPCCTATLCTAVPDCAPKALPCDVDGDGTLGTADMLLLLAAWGESPAGPPDFDGDGMVGVTDLLHLLGSWGPCP